MDPNYSSPRRFGNIPNSPTYMPPSSMQSKPFPFPKSPNAPITSVNPSKSYIHAKNLNFDPKNSPPSGKPLDSPIGNKLQESPISTKLHDNSFQHSSHYNNSKPETLKSTIDSSLSAKEAHTFPKPEGRTGPHQTKKQPRFSEPAMNPDLPFDPTQDPKKSFVPNQDPKKSFLPFKHEPKE